MNHGIIRNLIGKILMVVALLMAFPLICAIIYKEKFLNIASFLIPMGSLMLLGSILSIKKAKESSMGAREGFVIVGLSWILMSLFGALPFVISGQIPNFFTAFFEITSGFTTTGASALTEAELNSLSHSMLFFRSFSHWIGGMGILVFVLALIPESKEGSTMHILRAESPGPQVGKLVSKMQVTSRILYLIYILLTILEILILTLLPDKNMTFFDALICSFGTAGTGGFATTAASMGLYAPCSQYVIAVFMIIFGINFSLFYFMLIKHFKEAVFNEELRWYVAVLILSVTVITITVYNSLKGVYTLEETFRHSLFTVASIMSTTGYSTVDYGTWPGLTHIIILILMIFGACAGSTAGGMKTSRGIILFKYSRNKIKGMIAPRKVEVLKMDGKPVEQSVVESTITYFIVYVAILAICALLISIYNPGLNVDPLTAFTASLACISNVGPGLGSVVGPAGCYAGFSSFSKLVLSIEMIAGRLELFPILILFSYRTWKKRI